MIWERTRLACRGRRLAEHALVSLFCFMAVPLATAGERSVTAAEANGTYRDIDSKSEIKILALGHGKLKVQLALVYERPRPRVRR